MAWKYRKRVKVFPGVTLNLSKRGISTTVGPRGMNLNFNRNGTFLNTGLPGTGIYDRKRVGGPRRKNAPQPAAPSTQPDLSSVNLLRTSDVEAATTEGLRDFYETLIACHNERIALAEALAKGEKTLKRDHFLYIASCVLLIGFAIPWFRKNRDETRANLTTARSALEGCVVEVGLDEEPAVTQAYRALTEAYSMLLTASTFWDIAATMELDSRRQRTTASMGYVRSPITFTFGNLPFLRCASDGLHFQNAKGTDLYFYPGFVVVLAPSGKFGVLDLNEIAVGFDRERYHETGPVPDDARVVDHAWAKANKDGSRDRRFNDNHQIPVCEYGKLTFTSDGGLHEAFMASDVDKTENFAKALLAYKEALPASANPAGLYQ